MQYGCGLCAPEEWLNFDASPRLRIERVGVLRPLLLATGKALFPPNVRVGDIVRGLPVPDESARGVYCSHVLEHVPRDDVPIALDNSFRVLEPGGRFRLVMPDLQWRVARYRELAARGDPHGADLLLDSCQLGRRSRPQRIGAMLTSLLGHAAHLWMYDFPSVKWLLEEAGFAAVRRCALGDCADPMFALVEEESRFFEGGERELAVEAFRPLPCSKAGTRCAG